MGQLQQLPPRPQDKYKEKMEKAFPWETKRMGQGGVRSLSWLLLKVWSLELLLRHYLKTCQKWQCLGPARPAVSASSVLTSLGGATTWS